MVLSLQNLHINKHYLQDTLYVVLDTNVLLSHLKLISELKDFPIEGKLAGCMESHVTLSCKIYFTFILEFFKMAINLWGKCEYQDSHLPTSTSSDFTLVPLFKLPHAIETEFGMMKNNCSRFLHFLLTLHACHY